MVRLVLPLGLLSLLVGCSGAHDTPVDSTDSSGDSSDDTGTPFDPSADCDALGFPSVPFVEAGASAKIYDTAGDLTLHTTLGDWNLRQNWSGCDVYIFIPEEPAQNAGAPDPTWSTKKDNKALIDTMPLNTQVFFLSSQMGDDNRLVALDALKVSIDAQLDTYDAETRAWKERHIHYVTDKDSRADSWLGETLSSPGWGAAIDRTQRVRYIGSMADPERYDSNIGWFDPNISLVANEARYYNYEAARQERLDAEDATIVQAWSGQVISDPSWAGVTSTIDVVLPAADTMQTFDTLELDLTLLCEGDGEYGECPAWDYINSAYLCDESDSTVCTTELGRWITTYHREGRWVHDVSPLLALLKSGGTRRIAFYSQQPYEVSLTLRFSDKGDVDRPDEVRVLYTGGGVSSTYNDREALDIDVPDDVTRVALGVVMSGHGNPGCFEFCGTEHNFTVNGDDNLFTYEITDQTWGCMDQIEDGTVPNQYGTWWYGRNGWCPGKQVNMDVVDVTDQILFGQTNSFDYDLTNLDGSLDSGGNIDLVTWLVYYRAK
jgi:hypothetical protein